MLALHREGLIDSLSLDLEALDPTTLEDENDQEQWAGITSVPNPCSGEHEPER
ncbi:hypothetical protein LRP67_05635 [Nocardioides sp. cx-169]|uniref:hypothetical protein n=1 Tax=Nocardioides sp. cx-169 TaxID=2899080 RepID=UPI001E4B2043|nr:hypothetical protein [Nocardioides sp. cx-169]MCD4533557.1 hypothetical protein [Nocardioides sp. cx-169]